MLSLIKRPGRKLLIEMVSIKSFEISCTFLINNKNKFNLNKWK